MPESKSRKLCPSSRINSRTANINNGRISPSQAIVSHLGTSHSTDFTNTQALKLRAGDMRMARMQISLAQLRLEMEESTKLIEKLFQDARINMNPKPKQ